MRVTVAVQLLHQFLRGHLVVAAGRVCGEITECETAIDFALAEGVTRVPGDDVPSRGLRGPFRTILSLLYAETPDVAFVGANLTGAAFVFLDLCGVHAFSLTFSQLVPVSLDHQSVNFMEQS